MKNNTLLIIAAIGIVAYILLRNRNTTTTIANATGTYNNLPLAGKDTNDYSSNPFAGIVQAFGNAGNETNRWISQWVGQGLDYKKENNQHEYDMYYNNKLMNNYL
jgi:hypothetical protein